MSERGDGIDDPDGGDAGLDDPDGGFDAADGADAIRRRVGRLAVVAQLDPDRVDPDTLFDALETDAIAGGPHWRSLAEGIEVVAAADPEAVAGHRDRLRSLLADPDGDHAPLARAYGHTAGIAIDDAEHESGEAGGGSGDAKAGSEGESGDAEPDPVGESEDVESDPGEESEDVESDPGEESDDPAPVAATLVERLSLRSAGTGTSGESMIEGLAVAARRDPGSVADQFSGLVEELPRIVDEGSEDSFADLLAELFVADAGAPAGPVRPAVLAWLEASDRDRRCVAARAVGRAAARGCDPALDAVPRLVDALDATLPGFSSTNLRETVAVLAGLQAVAASRPDRLVPLAGTLLDVSVTTDATDPDPATMLGDLLADVARSNEAVYEALLDEVDPGTGWLSGLRSIAGDDRARRALVRAAPAHVDVLVRREYTVQGILAEVPDTGAELVAAVARERPGAVEWAVDPLLDRLGDRESAIATAELWIGALGSGMDVSPAPVAGGSATLEALGVLARTYPRVAETVVAMLADGGGREVPRAVAATRMLAEHAPRSLLAAPVPGDRTLAGRLTAAVSAGDRAPEAAAALTALGTTDPAVLDSLAGDVAELLREQNYLSVSPRHRAINVLGAATAYADPDGMEAVGITVFRQVADTGGQLLDPEHELDGLVLLLGALCSGADRFAEMAVDWLDADDAGRRRTALRVLAEGAWPGSSSVSGGCWPRQTALSFHLDRLVAATDRRQAPERAVATKALASAVGDPVAPSSSTGARLVDLAYDPAPAVRRWAAFGVGEWLASAGAGHGSAVERLELLADAETGRGTPVATLALVRAGERAVTECVADLATVARMDYRAIALAAVDELARTGGSDARQALERVRDEHGDPWVRGAAWRALDR